jgi:hypothetical protein
MCSGFNRRLYLIYFGQGGMTAEGRKGFPFQGREKPAEISGFGIIFILRIH